MWGLKGRKITKNPLVLEKLGKYFLGGLIFIILVSVLVWVFRLSNDTGLIKKGLTNFSPTPTLTPYYLLDSKNDGVYVNYEHGFKFSYPKETFFGYKELTESGRIIGANFQAKETSQAKDYYLAVRVDGLRNNLSFYDRYKNAKEIISQLDKESIPHHRVTKIKNVKIGGVEGFILYEKLVSDEVDGFNGHSLTLLKEGSVISIYLGTLPGQHLSDPQYNERLKKLEMIQSTLEFFK